jgi:hypothetical protein
MDRPLVQGSTPFGRQRARRSRGAVGWRSGTSCIEGRTMRTGRCRGSDPHGGVLRRDVRQQGIQQPAETMGHRDNRDFVPPPGTELHEVRMKRMTGAAGMMSRLAEHGPEFGGAALGNVAVPIAGARLVGTRDQTSLAGHMLGSGEALHIGEDWSCPAHEDDLSRGVSEFFEGRWCNHRELTTARASPPCVVASRPFGVVTTAPAFVTVRLAPHGFLGSWPTGNAGSQARSWTRRCWDRAPITRR